MTPNNRIHLTGYSGLRPLPPAGDAERWADTERLRIQDEPRGSECQRRV